MDYGVQTTPENLHQPSDQVTAQVSTNGPRVSFNRDVHVKRIGLLWKMIYSNIKFINIYYNNS